MTIYPPKAAPFTCAICHHEGPPTFEYGGARAMAPLCRSCEAVWGSGGRYSYGGWCAGPCAKRMDDRLARQINALATILSATAHCLQNGHQPPYV